MALSAVMWGQVDVHDEGSCYLLRKLKIEDVVVARKDDIGTSGSCLSTYVVSANVRYGIGGESLSLIR